MREGESRARRYDKDRGERMSKGVGEEGESERARELQRGRGDGDWNKRA